jgi:hypothetical protein
LRYSLSYRDLEEMMANAGITRDALLFRVKEGQLAGKMSEIDFDVVTRLLRWMAGSI